MSKLEHAGILILSATLLGAGIAISLGERFSGGIDIAVLVITMVFAGIVGIYLHMPNAIRQNWSRWYFRISVAIFNLVLILMVTDAWFDFHNDRFTETLFLKARALTIITPFFMLITVLHLLVLEGYNKSWVIWPLRVSVWLLTMFFIYIFYILLQGAIVFQIRVSLHKIYLMMWFISMPVFGGVLSILGYIRSVTNSGTNATDRARERRGAEPAVAAASKGHS